MCYRTKRLINKVLDSHQSGFDKHTINVHCNSCPACRRVRSNDWLVRAYFEFLNNHRNAFFFSLDFKPECLPTYKGVPCFDSELFKKFLKRLRSYIGSFRYLYVTEYGGFLKRPHYHIIVLPSEHRSLAFMTAALDKSWKFGDHKNVESIDSVNNNKLKALSYITDYVTKDLTFDLDKKEKNLPRRYCSRTQASKGFGEAALHNGAITLEMIQQSKLVSLPIGKNGKLLNFRIPRYYEMKFCYDYSYDPKTRKSELKKNEEGVKVSMLRHNRQYVQFIKSLFSTRWLPVEENELVQSHFRFNGLTWREVLLDAFDNFEDFKEFVYFRPFIQKLNAWRSYNDGFSWSGKSYDPALEDYYDSYDTDINLFPTGDGYVLDNLRNEYFYRPSWKYYESICRAYELYNSYFDEAKCKIETEKLIISARERARKKLERKPGLRYWLIKQNYDFSQVYPDLPFKGSFSKSKSSNYV